MKYKVDLNSCGDIDRGENPFKQVEGAWKQMAHCNSVEECQEKVREYIEKHNLGKGQWDGGEVYTKDNEYLGYISYNGHFWEGREK